MGFAADIIVWDLETRSLVHRLALHKVRVQSLSFSCDDKYLATLGGQDDNNLVVWEVETGKPVCGSPTSREHTTNVKFFNNSPHKLVTTGSNNMSTWDFDPANRKLRMNECHMGLYVRECRTMALSTDDEYVYFGSLSGDVLQVSLRNALFKAAGPKTLFPKGIECTMLAPTGDILVGTGDGTIALMSADTLRVKCQCRLSASDTRVTSLVPMSMTSEDCFQFLCGTRHCTIYVVTCKGGDFDVQLLQTCHFARVNDVAFQEGFSEVFATCSIEDIRVWHAREFRELLRVRVPNAECHCISFMPDGGSILSGWSDGTIRAFGPQTGKLLYTIHDAHVDGVTAIRGTADCERIVSGGMEGQVRVWRIGPQSQTMVASMKEHKGPVNAIQVRPSGSEFVSASSDGSCIIWDMRRFKRNTSLLASTNFKDILYHPDESQMLTTGTDRKITYWDAFDGQAIRIIDGSDDSEMTCLAISNDGEAFVAGGCDRLVKLYGYDEGFCHYVGEGHSGSICRVKISPDQKTIVSVGAEGGIFTWTMAAV